MVADAMDVSFDKARKSISMVKMVEPTQCVTHSQVDVSEPGCR